MHSAKVFVACVAIVSARVRLESWDESKQKERRERRGRGEKKIQLSTNNSIGNTCYTG